LVPVPPPEPASADPVRSAADRWADLLGRCTFPPAGAALVCAVSGGADSLALLVLATAAGCEVTAVHVDHGLRPGGADEAAVVADAAGRFGARFEARQVTVAPGPNLEARARAARWSVLPAGMRPGPRHPLLALRRADTEAVCAAAGLTPVVDPTNVDPAFLRNRMRSEVLPLLDDVAGRDTVPLLARTAAQARSVVDHLEEQAALAVPDPTDVTALRAAPVALASVALRRWLRSCSPERHPPDAAALDRVLSVVAGDVRATEIGGGWRVGRRAGRLVLEPPSTVAGDDGSGCRQSDGGR
jgi:tRNA(Ile)-lysidine synthase